jgi:hypothetical protein
MRGRQPWFNTRRRFMVSRRKICWRRASWRMTQLMRQHQQFQASMERGRDIRNERFVEGQYNKTKQKEDFVDYISDCQDFRMVIRACLWGIVRIAKQAATERWESDRPPAQPPTI